MTARSLLSMMRRSTGHLLAWGVRALTSPSATVACGDLIQQVKSLAPQPRTSDVERESILVLRPDGIGDVIMTGPFLRGLRRHRPEARITLAVAPRALNVVEACPYVDQVLVVNIPPPVSIAETWWRPAARRAAALSLARRHFRRNAYDVALVPRWGVDHHEASALAYLSRAPIRVGYSERVSPERRKKNRGYNRFFTDVIDDRSVKHEVQRNLALLSALQVSAPETPLEAWVTPQDEEVASELLGSRGKDSLAAIGPGAGHPKRVWPIDRFVEVGRWLTDRVSGLVVIGGPEDEILGWELQSRLGTSVIDLTNRTTLRQSMAVLKRCFLFCGNDGGPMHLAAAAGIPVVEISCHPYDGGDLHPNSPVRFGPWGVSNRVVRPPHAAPGCTTGCSVPSPHCILGVNVESVIATVRNFVTDVPASVGENDSS